ncbi:UNVERIFIED_CONTAM: SRPBCC family protein [Halobacillus marinus]
MPVLIHHQYIHAPVEICFNMARNVDVHTETTKKSRESAISGVTSGIMGLGDQVTWRAKHLGVWQSLTAQITELNEPWNFTDQMLEGAFHSFTHTHRFQNTQSGGTIMTDVFEYEAPFGWIGKLADVLFLKRYMQRLLMERAEALAEIALRRQLE